MEGIDMTKPKPKNSAFIPYYTHGGAKGVLGKSEKGAGVKVSLLDEVRDNAKQQGKLELAKTILKEGYAVGDKRYIAFEVERLKSQLKLGLSDVAEGNEELKKDEVK